MPTTRQTAIIEGDRQWTIHGLEEAAEGFATFEYVVSILGLSVSNLSSMIDVGLNDWGRVPEVRGVSL